MIPRRRLHRAVFVAAGFYNAGWGLYAAVDPQWLFRFAGMPLLNYPQIFACLGMVAGLYGLVYLEVARAPERGFPLAAVGLAGKLLGPVGLLYLILSGIWPVSTVVLVLTNDLIWWAPFGLYLYDSWPAFRKEVWGEKGDSNTPGSRLAEGPDSIDAQFLRTLVSAVVPVSRRTGGRLRISVRLCQLRSPGLSTLSLRATSWPRWSRRSATAS